MTELLIIVPHDRPELRDFWTQWFSGVPHVRVILDRRRAKRRRVETREPERRRADHRRQPGIQAELQSGWFDIIRQQHGASSRRQPKRYAVSEPSNGTKTSP